ncbi:MAG: TonB-dependent receptor [Gammaproteobacteria bacterium]
MEQAITEPLQKALAINLDKRVYGSIAEIGGGQETARWFFRAGGAAGTVAKSMSAYDMKFSDAIYGHAPRYVCRERLQAMLDHEYQLLIERLDPSRGQDSCFFAFANTVATRSYTYKADGHGWLGIRFQIRPGDAPSQIDLHVNLHGEQSIQDQETLGILGLNLIYAAAKLHTVPEQLLLSLIDNILPQQAEIDMIDFSGPTFANVDNRIMALRLVEKGMSNAALFHPDGHLVSVADTLWKKAVLVERSRFRPPTLFTMNLLDCARTAFVQDAQLDPDELIVIAEITLNNLLDGDVIDTTDYLHRVDLLCALGMNVLISNYGEYYRLAQYLFQYTSRPIALSMGALTLRELFNEKYYDDLPGGILESFGRLFKHDLSLYVSPALDHSGGKAFGLETFKVVPHLRHLYQHLRDNHYLRPLNTINPDYLHIYSTDVLASIKQHNDDWQDSVPSQVAQLIRQRQLFH